MKEQIEKHELSESIYMSGYGLERKDCDDIADQLYSEGYRKQSEWISVEDRMPPPLGKVLVYSPILGVYMTCYTAYSQSFAEPSVTHWMLLPEPPEMKGGE